MVGLYDVPIELIPKIIDNLDQKSLLKFGATNRILRIKSQKSVNYYKSVSLTQTAKKYTLSIDRKLMICFEEIGLFKTKIKYLGKDGQARSTEIRIQSIFDVVIPVLRDFLKRIGKRLEKLSINVQQRMRSKIIRNIRLKNLKNLREFEISCTSKQIDILKYNFIDFESLKNVRKSIKIPHTSISFDQLKQLKASKIEISLMNDNMNMENIKEYIDLWRNGQLHENFKGLDINCSKNSERFELNFGPDFGVSADRYGFKNIKSKIDENKHILVYQTFKFIWFCVCDDNNSDSESYSDSDVEDDESTISFFDESEDE